MIKTKDRIFKNGEVDLGGLFNLLTSNYLFLFKYVLFFILLSVFYLKLQTPLYKSTISFNPTASDSTSDILSLASDIGIDLSSSMPMPFYIPDIVNSRRVKKNIATYLYNTNKYEEEVNLVKYWEIDDNSFSINKIIKTVTSFIVSSDTVYDKEETWIEKAIEELEERIEIDESDEGLITVSVWMEEPKLSEKVGEIIATEIKIYTDEIHQKYVNNKNYIKSRLDEKKIALDLAEEELAIYIDKHQEYKKNESLRVKVERLTREVEIAYQAYLILLQQYEIASFEEKRNRYPIIVLDEPDAMSSFDKPNISLSIFLFMFLGFLSAAIRLIILNERKI